MRIKTESSPAPADGAAIQLSIENRLLFSDLNEVRFEWSIGSDRGEAKVDAHPGKTGRLVIPVKEGNSEGKTLELKAFAPQEFLLDEWRFPIGKTIPVERAECTAKATFSQTDEKIRIAAGAAVFEINAITGMIESASIGSASISLGGPVLMLLSLRAEKESKVSQGGQQNRHLPDGLRQDEESKMPGHGVPAPFNAPCSGWQAENVSVSKADGCVEVRVAGKSTEAYGVFHDAFFRQRRGSH